MFETQHEDGNKWTDDAGFGLVDTSLCRVCGEESSELVHVFSNEAMELDLLDKIHMHLPILVTKEDQLPQSLCSECLSKLNTCHDLVLTCHEANTKLMRLLAETGFKFDEQEFLSGDVQINDAVSIAATQPVEGKSSVQDDSTNDVVQQIHGLEGEFLSSDVLINDAVSTAATPLIIGKSAVQDDITIDVEEHVHGLEQDHVQPENNLQVKEVQENLGNDDSNDIFEGTVEDHQYLKTHTMDPENNLQVMEAQEKLVNVDSSGIYEGTVEDHQYLKTQTVVNDKSQFKVIVVKLTNSQNLPRNVQVSRALEVLKKKQEGVQLEDQGRTVAVSVDMNNVNNLTSVTPPPLDPVHQNSSLATSSNNVELEVNLGLCLTNDSSISPPDIERLVCKYCKKESVGRENLILHHIAAHPTKVFYCSECDIVCESSANFKVHLRKHNRVCTKPDVSNATEQGVEISNIVNVNVDTSQTVVKMMLSEEFKDMNKILKSRIVNTIQKIVVNDNEGMIENKMEPYRKRKVWKCKQCKNISKTSEEYKIHKKTHDMKCSVCGKVFLSRSNLNDHERFHKETSGYICEYCGKGFQYQTALRAHLGRHRGIKNPYKCDKCGTTYNSKSSYNSHLDHHSEQAQYLCEICGQSLKQRSNLRTHMRLHLDPDIRKRHLCHICGKGFVLRSRMIEHHRLHTKERPFVCTICGQRFRTQGQISQHYEVHANARRHACYICGKRFNRRSNMYTHVKTHQKPSCKICSESFPTRTALIEHSKSHGVKEITGVPRKNKEFKCNICDKVLSTRRTLQYHERSHTGEKPFKCNICGKSFANKNSVLYHTLSHTGEVPYKCRFCSRGCLTKQRLIVHERYHTGEKPFHCEKCPMTFRSRENLSQHLRVHSDLRPFNCTTCSKRFRRQETLDNHMRTHTGERPYSCTVCGRSFKQKGDCTKHERVHFKDMIETEELPLQFPCFACEHSFKSRDLLENHVETMHATEPPHIIVASSGNVLEPELFIVDDDNSIVTNEYVVSSIDDFSVQEQI